MGAQNLPHPAKAEYGGEDAFFVSEAGGGTIGIADGVGGWQENGINPADYSRTLMSTAREMLEGSADAVAALRGSEYESGALGSGASSSGQQAAVQRALAVAHVKTRLPGSSTACLLQLDRSEGVVHAANLGDSGFIVVRDGQVVYRTRPLEHFFDCPFQLGACPEYCDATDSALDADAITVPVQPGDVIVAGTDGLWDNAYEAEILPLLPAAADSVQEAAAAVAALARRNAEDGDYESPYTKEALAAGLDLPLWQKLLGSRVKGGKLTLGRLQGGKQDDITVVVAYVEREVPPPVPDGGAS